MAFLQFRTYIILVASVFTFIGLPSIQSFSHFESTLNFQLEDYPMAEEESESSKEEMKEADSKEFIENTLHSTFQCDQLSIIAFKELLLTEFDTYIDVSTPPPEFS